MGQALVTPDRLSKAANDAVNTGQSIATNLQRLLTSIEASVANFKGSASNAFQGTSHELARELKMILDALEQMAENVSSSNVAFGAQDSDAAGQINQVANAFSPGTSVVDALSK
ncbi:MAG: WXG100 family type VII secretion target [Micromonosporaceae bacterium]|nr:WXG100 family type VII secretion target [Micromonosporaceae bacterium]